MSGLGQVRAGVAFALLYLSYVVAYICRKNYGFWLNGILQRKEMDMTSAAVFGSTMEAAYGVGKLMAGPVADNLPAKRLLVFTLVVAAACNAFMFQTGVYYVDVALWAMNGIAQAFIWPALAMVFFYWFGKSPARGTLYSVLSTNQNVGSAITPIILLPFVNEYGWRFALWGPAIIGFVFSALLLVLLEEKPSSHNNTTEDKKAAEKPKAESSSKPSENEYVDSVKHMLKSPAIWYLGLGYAMITTVRVGLSDWSLVMLRTHRGLPENSARDCLVSLESGGFLGGLAAGFASDVFFKGKRTPIMVVFSILFAAPACYFVFFGPTNLITAAYFVLGFGSFGPHVLVGLLARELFPEVSSTAGSFAKSLAQVGGTMAGVPISYVTSHYGWSQAGMVWSACCALAGLGFALMLPSEIAAHRRLDAKKKE